MIKERDIMIKTTLKVKGMVCGMCEAHINDEIRKNFNVKKVSSSHTKGETVIISEEPVDEDAVKAVIAAKGYTVTGIAAEPYEKKRFSLFG